MVTISVVKPTNVDILPMDVIYRSKKCTDKIITSSGSLADQDGYHPLSLPFVSDAGENTVSNKIALSGGGSCDWKLSNIRLQFKYSNPNAFGLDITDSVPGDVVFIFDENEPPRGDGHYEDVYNDVTIEKDYYPMVVSDRLVKHDKYIEIKGKDLLAYRVHNTTSILFEPIVHSKKVITVLGPEKFGGDSIITYPDGSKLTDTEEPEYPNFDKLKMMK